MGSTFFAVAAVEALVVFGGLSSEGLSVDAVSFDDKLDWFPSVN